MATGNKPFGHLTTSMYNKKYSNGQTVLMPVEYNLFWSAAGCIFLLKEIFLPVNTNLSQVGNIMYVIHYIRWRNSDH